LGVVPHVAQQAVDPEGAKGPGGHRVHVEAADRLERPATLRDLPERVQSLRARGERHEQDTAEQRPRAFHPAPGEAEDRGGEEKRRAQGVHLQDDLRAGQLAGPGPHGRGGHQEVRPVVVHPLGREVGVHRRHLEARQLGRQRHVPPEVGGEVGAVQPVARGVGDSDAAVGHRHQNGYERQHARQSGRVSGPPWRERQERGPPGAPPPPTTEEGGRRQRHPRRDERGGGGVARLDDGPGGQAREAVADGRASGQRERVAPEETPPHGKAGSNGGGVHQHVKGAGRGAGDEGGQRRKGEQQHGSRREPRGTPGSRRPVARPIVDLRHSPISVTRPLASARPRSASDARGDGHLAKRQKA